MRDLSCATRFAKWGHAKNRDGLPIVGRVPSNASGAIRARLQQVLAAPRRTETAQATATATAELAPAPASALVGALRREAAGTPDQCAEMAPDAFEGTRPTGGALPTRDASVLANGKAQERSRMRKPVKRRRKQSADAPQELQSAAGTTRTGSARGARSSFCEIKGFTEQKEGLAPRVLTAPSVRAGSMKKPPEGGFPERMRGRSDREGGRVVGGHDRSGPRYRASLRNKSTRPLTPCRLPTARATARRTHTRTSAGTSSARRGQARAAATRPGSSPAWIG